MKMSERTINLPTVEVYGGEYTVVAQRINHLANNFQYSIDTNAEFVEILNSWKVKAIITITEKNEDGNVIVSTYSGHGCERIGSSEINQESALENAETSAIGRACASAGIGLTENFASAEEVKASKEVIANSKTSKRAAAGKTAEEKTLEKLTGKK
jgi:hypothetical protein